ncbi:hypothetical protein [Frondihabitans sp. PAMC 28766]|uniref:hypothetical protein n=1 Tax=Frondihabitans sp. PAMC 28766 TaxID=1795630 RepID=UPI0012FF793E|nr:hypothetical protein [Frondihabitans sp. PAMC 28766]
MTNLHHFDPDGSTNIILDNKERRENLSHGLATGRVSEEPHHDSDTTSGGDPRSKRSPSSTRPC